MFYRGFMILIVEETAVTVTFENTYSGATFHAWLEEGTSEWSVTRQGDTKSFGRPTVLGRVTSVDGAWFGYAGTTPGIEPVKCESRNEAFSWVTGDRDAEQSKESRAR